MDNKPVRAIAGFFILFCLYHAAEYFVLFKYNPAVFLSIQLLFFTAAFLIAKRQGYKGFSAWALKPSKGWWLQMLTGMAMGVLLYALSFYISTVVNGQTVGGLPLLPAVITPLGLFWFGNLFSSLSEDILTRGYLFRHIRPKIPSELFLFVSAAVYTLNHIYRLSSGWDTLGYLFLLGIVFAMPLVYSERLWYTAGMHWFGNTTFYFCYNTLQMEGPADSISPNAIFILCILFMIPLQYLLFAKLPYMQSQEKIVTEVLKQQ